MTEDSEKLLDDVGWRLLRLLQEHARLSFKELGRRVGLAPSSVAERIHRMEEAEILLGYHAEINLEKNRLAHDGIYSDEYSWTK